MSAEQAAALAEFARACKAAVRSVSLYPATHPAIGVSLSRVSSAAGRLTASGDITINVHPDQLVIDGRTVAKPDGSIAELASLLHERLVGAWAIQREADAEDWHALLLTLSRSPDDLIAAGGVAKVWSASRRSHFEIREIDYAEVLRERADGDRAEWDRILAFCLQGEGGSLDDTALTSLLAAARDPARFVELLERIESGPVSSGRKVGARAAALMQLLKTAVGAAQQHSPEFTEQVLDSIAASSPRLTPEMMLALLAQRSSPSAPGAQVATAVLERMTDGHIASFVANSVAAERQASERLAHAFEALVPEHERKERLLQIAEEHARNTELGREAAFEQLWRGAADMLMSYSDQSYVSDEYGRELSGVREQAIEVERVSDDPPDRVQQWLATVSDEAVQQLDLALILDLLRIESDEAQWQDVAAIAVRETERRTLLGDFESAERLASRVMQETGSDGRSQLAPAVGAAAERLASGPLVRHVVLHLRKTDDRGVKSLTKLCHAVGPALVRPLAEALAVEENNRAMRALREILLAFGAAGRQSVEQLKSSPNPAVRRTAIDLLRVFGGHEALPELASMLGDSDPQVQSDSIRAIVHIGTQEAYAVLEQAISASSKTRDTILQQLLELRDDKAIPLLCSVLNHTEPRGKLAQAHAEIIEMLGTLGPHPESTRTLRRTLYRGVWWAPFRTAVLRRAAATALMRIGTPDATAVLEEAAARGSRGVRKAARAQAGFAARRQSDARSERP